MLKKVLVWGLGLSLAVLVTGCSSKEDLLNASKMGDVNKVVQCLSDKIDVNSVDANGATSLLLATENNREQVVKVLIEKGANINASNKVDGNTPLHIAVMNSELAIIKKLVQNGALLDVKNNKNETAFTIKDKDGNTIFNQVAATNDIELTQQLVDKMPPMTSSEKSEDHPMTIQNNQGNTPLHTALLQNQKAIGKVFIDKGVNINFKNVKGEDAIITANGQKMPDILSYLYLKNGDLDNTIINAELALKTDANNVDVLYNFASALQLKGEKFSKDGALADAKKLYQQSIDNFTKVLALQPNFKNSIQKKDQCDEKLKNIEIQLKKQEEDRQKAEAARKAKEVAASQQNSTSNTNDAGNGYYDYSGLRDAIIDTMMRPRW